MVEDGGRVVYANPAYAHLAGCPDARSMEGWRVDQLSISPPHLNGSQRDYDFLQFHFGDEGRKLRLHVARDVTERRALELRLRESEKLEALGRLVGGVAHDFNNILTAIRLHTELLREGGPDATARHAGAVLQAASRGTDLVRQLLTFARQQPESTQVLYLREVIDSMRAVLEPLIGENIEVVRRFSARRRAVRADAAQIQQVLLNLVMNARDAMPDGGRICVGISGLRLSPEEAARHGIRAGTYVRLSVEDTGCGMTDDVRSRLFEPFFTTKKPGMGTGLGMSTVYGIVSAAGGAVWVASTVGKGTRISILLPEVRAPKRLTQKAANDETSEGRETILLAEDDASVRSSVVELLQSRGYRVLEACDGMDALRIAKAHKPTIDLLVSNIVMPRLGGPAAAARIHRIHPEAKFLFLSGYAAKTDRGLEANGPVLFKPFSRALLAQKVRETLERSPSKRATRGLAAAGGES